MFFSSKRALFETVVAVIADYHVLLIKSGDHWVFPRTALHGDELPDEAASRIVKESAGFDCSFVPVLPVEEMRDDARIVPLPFHIDALEGQGGWDCVFFYLVSTENGRTADLPGSARWFGKDDLGSEGISDETRSLALRAFNAYFDLAL